MRILHFGSAGVGNPARSSSLIRYFAVVCIVAVVFVLSACASPRVIENDAVSGAAVCSDVPCTHTDFRDDSDNFRFVIISDRTGGHRNSVFHQALKEVNLLEPAFVINIGDLVEGYTEDRDRLAAQWEEIDAMLGELDMPFFFVVGNHDMGNDVMLDVWRERHGREYYYFLYKDVLFLVLDTEDPPLPVSREIQADVVKLREVLKHDRDKAYQMVRESKALQRAVLYPKIGNEQVEYFQRVLAEYPDVRWTFVLLHKPAWKYGNENFRQIMALLEGKNYTVFAGHEHAYEYFDVAGKDYIQLGTTGAGMSEGEPGAFDHFVMVTVTPDGPKIANILLNGVLDRTGKPVASH